MSNGDKDLTDESVVRQDDLESDLIAFTNDAPPSKLRRERKSKFNVREILNLAPVKKPSTAVNHSLKVSESLESPKNGIESKRNSKVLTDPGADLDLNDSLDSKSEQSVSETGSEGTPSEKENFNCDMVGKIKSKSKEPSPNKMGHELTGKRERKRKKFADEEPDIPNKKVARKSSLPSSTPPLSKSKNSTKSSRVPQKADNIHNTSAVLSQSTKSPNNSVMTETKKRKILKNDNVDKKSSKVTTPVNNSRKTTVNKNINSEKSSDKNFSYLSFDFSLPQEKLMDNLIEGVTVPGSSKPVFIKAPKLPTGWVKKVVLRGVNNLKWEVVIENKLGKSFKSRTELLRYFDEQKFEANLDLFDFTLDTPLKKIRKIWREGLNNKTDLKSPVTNGVKDDCDTAACNLESRLPTQETFNSKSSHINQTRRANKVSSNKHMEKLKIELPTAPLISSDQSASSSPSPVAPLTSPSSLSSSKPAEPSLSPLNSPSLGKPSVNSPIIIKGNVSETGQVL